jgi:hypothetical protein
MRNEKFGAVEITKYTRHWKQNSKNSPLSGVSRENVNCMK